MNCERKCFYVAEKYYCRSKRRAEETGLATLFARTGRISNLLFEKGRVPARCEYYEPMNPDGGPRKPCYKQTALPGEKQLKLF